MNNQLSTFVRVNDRGPYDNNRIIDVSKAVAEKLNFSKNGVTPVQIEIMAMESKKLKEEMLNHQNTKRTTPDGEVILETNKILYPEMNNQQIDNLTLRQAKSQPIKEMQSLPVKPEKSLVAQSPRESAILYAGSNDTPKYYVQVGAFSLADSAQKVKENLKNHSNLFVTEKFKKKRLLHFVRIGPYKTQAECANVLDKVHASGYADAIIVFE